MKWVTLVLWFLVAYVVHGCGFDPGGLHVAGDASSPDEVVSDSSGIADGVTDAGIPTSDVLAPSEGNADSRSCVPSECLNADCTPVAVNHTRSGMACHAATCIMERGATPPSYCDGRGECVVHPLTDCVGIGGHCVGALCLGMFGENLLGSGMIDGGGQ
jgi:hypothetical protein